jgi:hypothetical protein
VHQQLVDTLNNINRLVTSLRQAVLRLPLRVLVQATALALVLLAYSWQLFEKQQFQQQQPLQQALQDGQQQ